MKSVIYQVSNQVYNQARNQIKDQLLDQMNDQSLELDQTWDIIYLHIDSKTSEIPIDNKENFV